MDTPLADVANTLACEIGIPPLENALVLERLSALGPRPTLHTWAKVIV